MHEKVELLLKITGSNKTQLAKAIGVQPGRISELKDCKWNPSAIQALRMARALGVSLDFLVDDEQEEIPSLSILDQNQWIAETIRTLGFERAKARLLRTDDEPSSERAGSGGDRPGIDIGGGGRVMPPIYPKRPREA